MKAKLVFVGVVVAVSAITPVAAATPDCGIWYGGDPECELVWRPVENVTHTVTTTAEQQAAHLMQELAEKVQEVCDRVCND